MTAAVIGLAVVASVALAAQKINVDSSSVALKGYDPVAYFTDGRPVQGTAQFEFRFEGATYRFASAEHRDLFAGGPQEYVPQFGGFCAYAVSRNYTADTDPLAWQIVEGKLFLNYSAGAQQKWEQDVPGNIVKGNVNWPKLRDK